MRTLLVALLLIACAEPCDPKSPDVEFIKSECAALVRQECPTLKHNECPRNQPCPQCPVLEQCDAITKELCSD